MFEVQAWGTIVLLVVEKMKDAGLLPHAGQAAVGHPRQPGGSSLQQEVNQVP